MLTTRMFPGLALKACLLSALLFSACGQDSGAEGSNESADSASLDGLLFDGSDPPTVSVISPKEGQVLHLGDPVSLMGSVGDDKTPAALLTVSWVSSIDGELDTPTPNQTGVVTSSIPGLSPGNHELVLSAVDERGLVGKASVNVVVNTLPGTAAVEILPPVPGTADDLTATVLTPAPDANRIDSELTYHWRWLRNNELTSFTGPTIAASETQRGDEWEVQVTARDPYGEGPAATAVTVIENTAPTCEQATVLPSAGNTNADFSCSCSLREEADVGDPEEDTCTFLHNGAEIPGAEGCTLPAESTVKGMSILCILTPGDSTDTGLPTESEPVLVFNTPPTAPTASLSPSEGTVETAFTCTLDTPATDLDGDAVSHPISWVVNDYVNPGTTTSILQPLSLVSDEAGTQARGSDTVTCRIHGDDGEALSAPGISNAVVLTNTPPTGGLVIMSPLGATESDPITCEASGALDPDGDLLSWTYTWTVNDELVEGVTGDTLDAAHFSEGDVISCDATPHDGTDPGEAVASKIPIVIANAPPSKPSVSIDAPNGADGPITCVLLEAATDKDEVSYTYYWSIDSADEQVGTAEFNAASVGSCTLLTCRVVASDGLASTTSEVSEAQLPAGDDCSDNNPCTTHTCLPSGGCEYVLLTTACNDGNACTKNDTCQNGNCVGTYNSCDDGDACTTDACDPAVGCSHTVPPNLCNDSNTCTIDTCNPATGQCQFTPIPNGQGCNFDDNGCTVGDTCQAGVCIPGTPADCGQAINDCVQKTCQSISPNDYVCNALYLDETLPCDDGLFCTVGDHCNGAGGCIGSPRDCTVGIGQCRSGSCNEGANACDTADKPDGTTCDADGNGCTENDSCAGGICLIGNNVDCSDSSDTCNVGGCENLGGIYFACVQAPKPLNLPCDDGDYCTVDTVCDGAGSCSDGNPRDCDAELGTQCTTGFCDALAQACAPLKIPDGTSCEDNNVCTLVDNCKNGTCVGTGDACVENRLDQTLPATVAPSLVHLGFGRYATVWVDEGGQGSRVRLTDRYGSRESEEVVVSPTDTLPPTSGLSVAAQSTGEFLTLGWSGEFVCDKGFYPCEVSGALHGLQYDVDGSFLTQQALLPIDGSKFNGNTGGVLTGYESHALALPDGSYGLVSATMGKMIVSPAPGEIRWIPVSKELVPGDSVLLVSSDVTIPSTTNPPGGMTPANFDVAHAPDSSLFTVAWIVPGGGEIRARSFESTGLAVGEAWTAHTSPALNEVRELALITRPDHSLALFWEQGEVNDEASALFTRTLSADGLVQSEPQEIADTPVGHKQLGDIDTFSDGGFVVVYDDDQSDESGRAVRAQLFEPSGAPIGGSFQINSLTNGDQLDARLAVLESDTWVVAFRDEDHVLWTKRYFKDGSEHVGRLEQPITVDPNNDQVHTVGARCSTNGLFIAWEHTVPGNTGTDIRGRFFNAAGSPLNDEITLNQHTAGDQSHPAMTSNNDRATIVWSSAEADESGHGVFAVQVNASGIIASDDIQVHTTLSNQNTAPDVAMQEDGRYAITWVHEGTDADILARVYPANDGAPTLEFFANETMIGDQRAPAVAATDSSFVVFWQSKTDDRWTIVGRLIDAQGQPLTGEISMDENAPVNPATVTNHTSPAVAVGPDGNGLLCWESDGINPGEPLDHVECQRFDGQALTLQGPVFPANPAALNDTSQPAVLALPNGMLGVAWSALNIDGDGWSVQYQLFNDSGQPIGARVVANRTRAGNQIHPFITGLSHTSPTFAVGWQTEDVNAGWWDNTFRVLQPQ